MLAPFVASASARAPGAPPPRGARRGRRWWGAARREPTLYLLYAAACTLGVALVFFRSMRQQVTMLYASLGGDPLLSDLIALGPWSAPLDDVFIHFDFARATARGHPFEWSEGNGFSSGGTSLSYPFVLAIGYALGFVDLHLLVWAAVVAAVSVLGLLLAARRLFEPLPRWTTYLAPPLLLGTGVLDWSLWSGMETAFFLGTWALTLALWFDLVAAARAPGRAVCARALGVGAAGALAVATRPEAVSVVAIFGVSAACLVLRRRRWTSGAAVLVLVGAPGALVVIAHAVANLMLTGDAAAAGAISKLEAYDPFRGWAEILEAWGFFFGYQVDRITHYHLAADGRHGLVVWVLALVALLPRQTRRSALLLWTSAIAWTAIVAFNGQVRWQNERYAMPALAWILLAAALGAGALGALPAGSTRRARGLRLAGFAAAAAALGSFGWSQAPRFREQVWFFGRASRNILEQHVRVGLLLRRAITPRPRRVAVGDAGAIPYAADLPALDLIGLGGYHDFPFARAKRHGLGAVVELLERMPADDRPDLYALYPSWWDTLPIWFGERIGEVEVHGNVICAGAAKVLYRPDYSPFDGSASPVGLEPAAAVIDEMDVADLVSERQHEYGWSLPGAGHVDMKLLPHPRHPARPLWDAGRIIPAGVTERVRLRSPRSGGPFALVFRLAPTHPLRLDVTVGAWRGSLEVSASDSWQHPRLEVPRSAAVPERMDVTVRAEAAERVSYHLWVVEWR